MFRILLLFPKVNTKKDMILLHFFTLLKSHYLQTISHHKLIICNILRIIYFFANAYTKGDVHFFNC